MSKLKAGLSGVAGEYFVAAELSRRGKLATLTLKNTKGIDILASNLDASKSAAIQVKTRRNKEKSWTLNKKVEVYEKTRTNLWFVFVRLHSQTLMLPEYYVVPAADVAKFAREYHEEYLKRGGKDSDMRAFRDDGNLYKDKWDLLGLD